MKIIPTAVSSKFGRQLLQLQKVSPQVMFAGGVIAGGVGVVLACKSTLKLSDTLSRYEELREKAAYQHENGVLKDDGELYDDKAYAKDLAVIKVKTLLDITKLYAPSASLLILSAVLLTGSHVTLNRRNAGLTAAYASVDKAFQEYRERVTEKLGAEADQEFRYETQEVSETIEGADGKKKNVKHTRVGDGDPSQYARFFDESSVNHQRNPEYNKIFLQSQQNYFNQLLKARGHVFLNEVYDALGLQRSGAGQVVGWVISKDSDNYVDFGIFDNVANPNVRDFVNGNEYSILLDFNVDGVVYDKI